ncbi:MAG TPA: protein phosphatase 2C domain-containing protein [Mycobacteriales bacterium]|nr:protein phosphatase 2C domain-containing protein [Mycobacteriales bacterium]
MNALTAVVATDRGAVRAGNEDRVGVFGWVAPVEQATPVLLSIRGGGPAVVAVADGLGGHACGERASRLAVQWLLAAAPRLDGPAALREELVRIHGELLRDAAEDPARAGMGTTLVAALVLGDGVLGDQVVLAHVGDSRAYHVEPGLVERLTDDDAAGGGAITQCLGGLPGVEVYPHLDTQKVAPTARLLLCTDGLHGVVPAPLLRELLAEPDPVRCVSGLMDAAAAGGAPDNVSVCLLCFDDGQPWRPSDG